MQKIKNITIKGKSVLGPMLDFSHLPFRLISRDFSASLCFTEMVFINHLTSVDDPLDIPLLKTTKQDSPLAVQLVGDFRDLKTTLKASEIIDSSKDYDVIDFNLGCPSQRVHNSYSGSYILKDIDSILDTIKTVSQTTKKPVTTKIRLGYNQNKLSEISKKLEKTGIDALTVHGRLSTDNYSKPSDYKSILNLKNNISIPLIYNGDVNLSNFDFYTDNFDLVMVSRGALGQPEIFEQIEYYNKNNEFLKKSYDKISQLKQFLDYCKKYDLVFSKVKIGSLMFLKGLKNSSRYRSEISSSKSISEIEYIISRIK